MPNKKNPDPAELVRGRAARSIAALTAVLTILKGLPLAYQRDLQEDKPPLFGAVGIFEASLGVLAGMLDTLTVDRERMRAAAAEGFTTATSVADTLVRQGVPFRAAHHVVGTLVAGAEEAGIGLEALDDDDDRRRAGGQRRSRGHGARPRPLDRGDRPGRSRHRRRPCEL